jgi:hypothetical protein
MPKGASNSQSAGDGSKRGSALNGGAATPFSWHGGFQTRPPDRGQWIGGDLANPLFGFVS